MKRVEREAVKKDGRRHGTKGRLSELRVSSGEA